MKSNHKKRMQQIGSVALPPKGTPDYDFALDYLKKNSTKQQNALIKKLWEKSVAIITCQQNNGAGHQTDQSVRWFQQEYNNRAWSHGLHSFPSSFNVAEAFFKYRPDLNSFILLREINNLFSFPSYVDWYTSNDIPFDHQASLEKMEPGVIYTYDNLLDPAELLYNVENGNEIAVAGFAMVRFGSEISIMCVGGESADLKKESQKLVDSYSKYQSIEGRDGIKPNPEYSIEAVGLESKESLWRFLALTRFNIKAMSQSVRYVMHDNGIAFRVLTDDPTIFLKADNESFVDNAESMLAELTKQLNGYNALFDLCSTVLFLPQYFDEFAEDVVVDRFKTEYSKKANKVSFKKIRDNSPVKYRLAYRNVNVLRGIPDALDARELIYSSHNFHMETSGFWKTLEPGKYGVDKKGNPIHGKTWVSKKLTWMEAEEPSALIARNYQSKVVPSDGKNPGYIYIMRAPLHSKNVFKIGLTTRDSDTRANELSSATGLPGRIYVINQWAVSDCKEIERKIHNRLADYRVDPRREFFEGSLEFFISTVNAIIQEYNQTDR